MAYDNEANGSGAIPCRQTVELNLKRRAELCFCDLELLCRALCLPWHAMSAQINSGILQT
jgi:hypothetical protein